MTCPSDFTSPSTQSHESTDTLVQASQTPIPLTAKEIFRIVFNQTSSNQDSEDLQAKSDDWKQEVRAMLQDNVGEDALLNSTELSMNSGPTSISPTFNILVLGETGSGKTTLIEVIRQYSRKDVMSFDSNIVQPNTLQYPQTNTVSSTEITTTLPRYILIESFNDSRPRLLDCTDARNYLRLRPNQYGLFQSFLSLQEDYQPENACSVNLRLIDTPGLQFCGEGALRRINREAVATFSSKTLPAIINELGPSCAVHLLILVIPSGADLTYTLQSYREILPPFESVVVIHSGTNERGTQQPASNYPQTTFGSAIGDKHVCIKQDNLYDLCSSDNLVQECLAQNRIRDILELALFNEPMFLPKAVVAKPVAMKEIDEILQNKYAKLITGVLNSPNKLNPLRMTMKQIKEDCDEFNKDLRRRSYSPLKLIFSHRFDAVDYPQSHNEIMEVSMTWSENTIAQVDILQRNVYITSQIGGTGTHEFRLLFRWKNSLHGVLDVRVYVHSKVRSTSETQRRKVVAIENAVQPSVDSSNQNQLLLEVNEEYRHFFMMQALASAQMTYPGVLSLPCIQNGKLCTLDNLSARVEELEQAYFIIQEFSKELDRMYGGSCWIPPHLLTLFRRNYVERRTEAVWSKVKYLYHRTEAVWTTIKCHHQSSTAALSTSDGGPFNILVLGGTQTGRSTFIESVKQYADERYLIDKSAIGDGSKSHTDKVITGNILTQLPVYHVEDTSNKQRNFIHPAELTTQYDGGEDYADIINKMSGLKLRQLGQQSKKFSFNLVDTPGPNDTSVHDLSHITKLSNVLPDLGNISMVLVTVHSSLTSQEILSAIQSYFDAFPDFNGVVAFLHTHVDYADLHHTNKPYHQKLARIRKRLERVVKRTDFPEFYIDCDIFTNRPKPLRQCITNNTIEKILSLAASNHPIAVPSVTMNKTQAMKDLDKILIRKYWSVIDAMDQKTQDKWVDIANQPNTMFDLDENLIRTNARIQAVSDFERSHGADDFVLLYEERYDRDWDVSGVGEPFTISFGPQRHIIDRVDILTKNIGIVSEEGGQRRNYWRVIFYRRPTQSSIVHVKIYSKQSNICAEEIDEAEYKRQRLEADKTRLEMHIDDLTESFIITSEVQQLRNERKGFVHFIEWLMRDSLLKEDFIAAVSRGAYVGELVQGMRNIELFYFDTILPRYLSEFGGSSGGADIASAASKWLKFLDN